jgi:hypothetical protein
MKPDLCVARVNKSLSDLNDARRTPIMLPDAEIADDSVLDTISQASIEKTKPRFLVNSEHLVIATKTSLTPHNNSFSCHSTGTGNPYKL